jgi:hypothetical protein
MAVTGVERTVKGLKPGTIVTHQPDPNEPPAVPHVLRPSEEIQHAVTAGGLLLAVTTDRIAVMEDGRAVLDVSIDDLRRIQFDIKKRRPASLVIAPEHPGDPPLVQAVLPTEYPAVAAALVSIGQSLASRRDGEGAAQESQVREWCRGPAVESPPRVGPVAGCSVGDPRFA